jgi:tetratricopeptide (TPR) repeat protein
MRAGAILRAMVIALHLPLPKSLWQCVFLSIFAVSFTTLNGQAPSKTTVGNGSGNAEQAIAMASKGKCREALPLLKKAAAQATEKNLKYDILMSTARCAIGLEQTDTAVKTLLELNHTFSKDPEVLYLTTHYYSELAMKASQSLAEVAPDSAQAQQLEAEAFESQGQLDKAVTQYRTILEKNPQRHGIHYRLGRLYLTKTPADTENARKEFEDELKIDPNSAAAEFLMGEIDRQAGQWDDAIKHFGRATKLDEGFVEAYLALGISLNAAGKFGDAVSPLENYVKVQPDDPAGHYQLATAYARKQDAQREMTLQQETAAKSPRTSAQQ